MVHFLCFKKLGIRVCLCAKLPQLPPILCVPMDCSPQASVSMGFSRQNTGVGCHFFLQGISPTQGLSLHLLYLLHGQWVLYHYHHLGSPGIKV